MSEPFVFTEPKVRDLEPPDRGRVYYRDVKVPGLQVCITSTGTKTYYFVRRIDGKPTRIRLGTTDRLSVKDARTAAAKHAGKVAGGENPQAERKQKRDQPTIGELFKYWIKHLKAHSRTWEEYERLYNAYIKPWDSRRLADITSRQVELWHSKIGEKKDRTDGKKGRKLGGPYVANRALGLLRAAYEKAEKVGYMGDNPAVGVTKFPEEQRDRYLSGDELKNFFESLSKEPDLYQDFFTISLLTGARRGNVQAMRWENVNLANRLWRIPGQVSKGGKPIFIPLVPGAVEILKRRQAEADPVVPWVFPSRKHPQNHLVEPRASWRRICDRANLKDVRPHDLRRTLGSWQVNNGASLAIIGKSLGHRPGSPATAVYAQIALDPVRQSVENATRKMQVAAGLIADENVIDVGDKEGGHDG
ncbi:MAG: tyrosine-type recombinase/integrase [Pirellulales bacterium]|nr:tyrosine-type recombinase/integrase [Pirellulales bacterium]